MNKRSNLSIDLKQRTNSNKNPIFKGVAYNSTISPANQTSRQNQQQIEGKISNRGQMGYNN